MGWGDDVEEMSFKKKRASWKDDVETAGFRRIFHKKTLFDTAKLALSKTSKGVKKIQGLARSVTKGTPYARPPSLRLPRGF